MSAPLREQPPQAALAAWLALLAERGALDPSPVSAPP